MSVKATTHPLVVRFTVEERQFLEGFRQQLTRTQPGVTLSDAVRALVAAGRRAMRAPADDMEGLTAALLEMDPKWSGKKPIIQAPPAIQTRSGADPVELIMARRRKKPWASPFPSKTI